MMQLSWEWWTTVVGGVFTLGIFSYLWRENRFYRFCEHLFIGIAAGWAPIYVLKNFLWPKIFAPIFIESAERFPDGSAVVSEVLASGTAWWVPYLYLPALAFGSLYYAIFFKRFSWLARLVIGFSLGASAGLTFKGWFVEMVPQITTSMKPLIFLQNQGEGGAIDATQLAAWWSRIDGVASFNNTIFVMILVSVMTYFFFTFGGRRDSVGAGGVRAGAEVDGDEGDGAEGDFTGARNGAGKLNRVDIRGALTSFGRYSMMVCFGAFFGSTIMARMALLVERVQFLVGDFWAAVAGVFIL